MLLRLGLLFGVVAATLILLRPTEASHPYNYGDPEPLGNRAVEINWAYCTASVACWSGNVLDWTGRQEMVAAKGTSYYVTKWNGYLNREMYIRKDPNPIPYGTTVVVLVKPEACSPPGSWTCYTHTHSYTNASTFGSCGPGVVETNGNDHIDCSVVHLSEGTLGSGASSLATVVSHEVGHHLFLADHSGTGTDTIMHSPNPGILQPTTADKRTAAECRYVSYC